MFYVEKDIYFNSIESHVNVYFTDRNIMQWSDPRKLNFEGLEMQKWNVLTDIAQKVD